MSKRVTGRILVVKPSSLGDIVHLFPALELLKRVFPGAELDYLVNPVFADALAYSPWKVSHSILFERGKLGRAATFAGTFIKLLRALREREYDCVIDFQGLFRSAFFARIAAGTAPVIGFAEPRERSARWFYSAVLAARGLHAVERNVELAGYFFSGGAPEIPALPPPPVPDGVVPPPGLPERYLLLLPGARWKSKMFPVKLFAETAGLVSVRRPDLALVVAGGADESAVAAELCRALPPGTVNLCGKTSLAELFEVIRGASGVLCNDSGPLHIAALMRRPVGCFFGPTRPEATGPWGSRAGCRVYRRSELSCLGCMRRECRSSEAYGCFNIDPRRVAEDMCAMLESNEVMK